MTVLVVLTVIVIVALIAGLAFYLYWAGTLLDRIGAKLEGAAELVHGIVADAELIGPGVEHINQTGGVQAVDQLTSTVPARLTSVNANLKPVRDFCETV